MISENEEKWLILNSKLQKTQIIKAFQTFRSEGIEPILIKGFAIERFYPKNVQRISFDIDLAVSPTDFDISKELIQSDTLHKINIDLHKGLRHLDTKDWKSLYVNSQLIEVEGTKIRVLSEEDHLRVLCIHWLTDGGENKKKLWDIYYAVENRYEEFDWDKCFEGISQKRKLWIIYSIGLAHKYLDLEVAGLPFNESLPIWLTKSVEKIWSRKHPFIPLDACYNNREMFLYQIRLRLTPNPIMATVGVEGHFDSRIRSFYQIRYFFKRSVPSLKSFIRHLFHKAD